MILLIIFTVVIGRTFFRLAHDYHKSEWPYALLGGGVFLGASILFSIVAVVIMLSGGAGTGLGGSLIASIIAYALAGSVCLIIYRILKNKWESERPIGGKGPVNDDLLDN